MGQYCLFQIKWGACTFKFSLDWTVKAATSLEQSFSSWF